MRRFLFSPVSLLIEIPFTQVYFALIYLLFVQTLGGRDSLRSKSVHH